MARQRAPVGCVPSRLLHCPPHACRPAQPSPPTHAGPAGTQQTRKSPSPGGGEKDGRDRFAQLAHTHMKHHDSEHLLTSPHPSGATEEGLGRHSKVRSRSATSEACQLSQRSPNMPDVLVQHHERSARVTWLNSSHASMCLLTHNPQVPVPLTQTPPGIRSVRCQPGKNPHPAAAAGKC